MDKNELKRIVAKLLSQGKTLPEIQSVLDTEYKQKLTFMELRLIAAEVENIDWEKLPGEKEKAKEGVKDAGTKEINADSSEWGQGTVVEVSKLTRPGTALNGSVNFASGASADWAIDQYGRCMFSNAKGKPTEEDIEEFQMELQRKLGGG